jgi:hypothetical protein
MALSAFDDKARMPAAADLTRALGPAAKLWDDALRLVAAEIGSVSPEWGYTSKSTGWGLRVKRGERIIAYLTPGEGQFLASFALGKAAVTEVRAARVPKHILTALASARTYAEGTGLRFTVSTAADVRAVAAIAGIKSRN